MNLLTKATSHRILVITRSHTVPFVMPAEYMRFATGTNTIIYCGDRRVASALISMDITLCVFDTYQKQTMGSTRSNKVIERSYDTRDIREDHISKESLEEYEQDSETMRIAGLGGDESFCFV